MSGLPVCTKVDNDKCTIEESLYGYRPSLGANSFFAGFFGLCLIVHLVLGIRYKTWTFMIAMSLGCLGEVIGYIGRVMLYNNVYNDLGFQIQICCLIISPAFVSGAIYLTLKHLVLSFGTSWSRLRPSLYTTIFISGDIFSLVLQGAGGGIAATADPNTSLQDVGTNLMIAGVIFQVVCLAVFGYFLSEYVIRTRRHRNELTADSMKLFHDTKFRCFAGGLILAYVTVFTRCIYRIPELTGGWGSELMKQEAEFIALEGVMIVIAVAALTILHPGFCFPALANTFKSKKSKSVGEGSDIDMIERA